MCEPQMIRRLAFYSPQCWAHPMASSGFMHKLNCDLAPQHLLLCKPWCWSSISTPRAVSRMEVFLCPHRCKEEPPRPRAMQKEATVVNQGHDHPPVVLTPARSTPRDPPLLTSLHILATVVRCHCTWEFHLSEYDSEYRKKPKGLWQSQINILSSPRAGALVLTHSHDSHSRQNFNEVGNLIS